MLAVDFAARVPVRPGPQTEGVEARATDHREIRAELPLRNPLLAGQPERPGPDPGPHGQGRQRSPDLDLPGLRIDGIGTWKADGIGGLVEDDLHDRAGGPAIAGHAGNGRALHLDHQGPAMARRRLPGCRRQDHGARGDGTDADRDTPAAGPDREPHRIDGQLIRLASGAIERDHPVADDDVACSQSWDEPPGAATGDVQADRHGLRRGTRGAILADTNLPYSNGTTVTEIATPGTLADWLDTLQRIENGTRLPGEGRENDYIIPHGLTGYSKPIGQAMNRASPASSA